MAGQEKSSSTLQCVTCFVALRVAEHPNHAGSGHHCRTAWLLGGNFNLSKRKRHWNRLQWTKQCHFYFIGVHVCTFVPMQHQAEESLLLSPRCDNASSVLGRRHAGSDLVLAWHFMNRPALQRTTALMTGRAGREMPMAIADLTRLFIPQLQLGSKPHRRCSWWSSFM